MPIAEVGDVAVALDLPDTPTGRDGQALALALAAAIEAVTEATRPRLWELITSDTEATSRTYPGGCQVISIADVAAGDVTVEESSDLSTWTETPGTGWHIEPFNGEASPPELWRHGCAFMPWVRVTGKHGVAAYPAVLTEATVMYAARLYERRKSPSGVTYGGDFGPIRISRAQDPDVMRLLDSITPTAIA